MTLGVTTQELLETGSLLGPGAHLLGEAGWPASPVDLSVSASTAIFYMGAEAGTQFLMLVRQELYRQRELHRPF